MKITIAAMAGLFAISGVFHSVGDARAPVSVWAGVYTQEQAKHGAVLYKEECAACHGETLGGNGRTPRAEELGRLIPPLCGDGFKGNWNGKPLSDLFDKMKATMPRDDPGKLGMEQNVDLLAFILNFNEFPSGKTELPADPSLLTEIRFDAVKPQ
jgi:cytochrome c